MTAGLASAFFAASFPDAPNPPPPPPPKLNVPPLPPNPAAPNAVVAGGNCGMGPREGGFDVVDPPTSFQDDDPPIPPPPPILGFPPPGGERAPKAELLGSLGAFTVSEVAAKDAGVGGGGVAVETIAARTCTAVLRLFSLMRSSRFFRRAFSFTAPPAPRSDIRTSTSSSPTNSSLTRPRRTATRRASRKAPPWRVCTNEGW